MNRVCSKLSANSLRTFLKLFASFVVDTILLLFVNRSGQCFGFESLWRRNFRADKILGRKAAEWNNRVKKARSFSFLFFIARLCIFWLTASSGIDSQTMQREGWDDARGFLKELSQRTRKARRRDVILCGGAVGDFVAVGQEEGGWRHVRDDCASEDC